MENSCLDHTWSPGVSRKPLDRSSSILDCLSAIPYHESTERGTCTCTKVTRTGSQKVLITPHQSNSLYLKYNATTNSIVVTTSQSRNECEWSLDKLIYQEGCSHHRPCHRLRSNDHFLMSTTEGMVKPEDGSYLEKCSEDDLTLFDLPYSEDHQAFSVALVADAVTGMKLFWDEAENTLSFKRPEEGAEEDHPGFYFTIYPI